MFDSEAGYHQFHNDAGEAYGSFEVFWSDGKDGLCDDDAEPLPAGWFWAAGLPGCLYDGDPSGPFASSSQARADADENWEG